MRPTSGRYAASPRISRCILGGVALCASAILGGCSSESTNNAGSGSGAPASPKPPLAATRVISLPGASPRGELFVKPGHWSATWVEAQAAESDFRGTLTGQWVDDSGASLGYPPTEYRLRHVRPAVLPKAQLRGLEQLMFAPDDDDNVGPGVADDTESRLREASGRFQLVDDLGLHAPLEARQRITVLRDHQAMFVVLAERTTDYAFLGKFDAVSTPHSPHVPAEHDVQYRLVFAAEPNRALLPATILGWTTTAYVLWDGFDAAKMNDAQRTALVDWLHWGGVLIVGGPGTLDGPACEPLREWLPATAAGALELDAAALKPLDELTIDSTHLTTARSWAGVRLVPTPQSRVLVGSNEAPLVVERRVGRGRILATAFRPAQSQLIGWPSYGSFFNGFLMRRPPRHWRPHPLDENFFMAVWADRRDARFEGELREGAVDPWYDPSRVSNVRFAARSGNDDAKQHPMFDAQPPVGPGVAAWRDDDAVTETARSILREASGIFVPSASTVFQLIALYVFTAVPANWLVFAALRRTEWAWFATPIIAVVFMVIVVRTAELDLGFVRSAGQTTIIEIQSGYDRGHASHFAAVYNSLGTSYDVAGDDATFEALPLALFDDRQQPTDARTYELIRRDDESGDSRTDLADWLVNSNSVRMLRAEHMIELGGTIRAEHLPSGRVRITNGTRWELRDVRLTGRYHSGFDRLPPGGTATVDLTASQLTDEARARIGDGDVAARREWIDVDPLWRRFQTTEPEEDLRLTAWSPTETPGLTLEPRLSQTRQKTIIVAHLRYADESPPENDPNTAAEVAAKYNKPLRILND